MEENNFRMLVTEVLEKVPEKFARLMDNVAVLVEDVPSDAILHEQGITPGEGTLLGLYHGVPRTERGVDYGVGEVVPDTITLFRLPILDVALQEQKEVSQVVYETLWHEIAHYMGFDEHAVARREEEGTNRYHV